MLTCDKIDIVEQLPSGDYVLRVILSDGRTPLWIYDQQKAMEFINKEVIVVTRKDIYKGEMQDFIATFTIPTVVNVLPQQDNLKLYLEVADNLSDCSFSEIAMGETRFSSTVYCSFSEFKSSASSRWQELTIRDKSMHTAKLRIFDYDNNAAEYTGRYVLAALTRTPYGFQTKMITPVQGEVTENPEIALADNYVKNYFANDIVAQEYINHTGILDKLKSYVDYEPGYALMRMAMELATVDSMKNITKDVDLRAISEAILCSFWYLCKTSVLSSYANNLVMAMNYKWENKPTILSMLDAYEEGKELLPEARVFKAVKDTVNTLLEVRKGVKL